MPLTAPLAAAQDPEIVWQRGLPLHPVSDHGLDVLPIDDGGAWLVAEAIDRNILSRVDAAGIENLRVSFQGVSSPRGHLSLASDGAGGVFVAGEVQGPGFADPPLSQDPEPFLARIDAQGVVWARRIALVETAVDIVEDGSGGVWVTGDPGRNTGFGGPDIGLQDAYLLHVDGAGTVLAEERYGERDHLVAFETLEPNPIGGGFDCGGYKWDFFGVATWRPLVVRMSAQAIVRWERTILDDGMSIHSVSTGATGRVMAVGQRQSDGVCRWYGLRPNGGVEWMRDLPNLSTGFPTTRATVRGLGDGTFALAYSWPDPFAGGRARVDVVRADDAGGILGEETLASVPGEFTRAWSGEIDRVGSLMLVGSTDGSLDPASGLPFSEAWISRWALDRLGTAYCPGVPNSTGVPAETHAVGSDLASMNGITLYAKSLPERTFGYFLGATSIDMVPNAGGSMGTLCLGGHVGRFNRSGEVFNSGGEGSFHLSLDLSNMPTPQGAVSATAGETWSFQAWYRDFVGGLSTNLTGAVSVTLR